MTPLMLAWVTGLISLTWFTTAAPGASAARTEDCHAELSGRYPVRLADGQSLYVGGNTFVSNGARTLLAGTPNYVWPVGWRLDSAAVGPPRNSVLGVVLSGDRHATAVPWPRPGHFAHPRAAALPDGRWAVTMAEVVPELGFRGMPLVTAYWGGITDGEQWWEVQKLPPVAGELRSISASRLVTHGGGLSIAVPLDLPPRPGAAGRADAAVYSYTAGSWQVSIVPTRRTSYVALVTSDDRGLLLAAITPDTTLMEDGNSLILYSRRRPGAEWVREGRLVRGGRTPIHAIDFVGPPSDVRGAWLVMSDRTGAKASLGLPSATGENVFTLSELADEVIPLYGSGLPPLWVTDEPGPSNSNTIQLYELRDTTPARLISVPSPFRGRIGAVLGSNEILVTGEIWSESDAPELISEVMVIRLSCHSASHGSRPDANGRQRVGSPEGM